MPPYPPYQGGDEGEPYQGEIEGALISGVRGKLIRRNEKALSGGIGYVPLIGGDKVAFLLSSGNQRS